MSRRRLVRLATTLTVLVVLVVLAVGWFNSADPVPAQRVADAVADALESRLGFRPDVVCPDDLEAEVGAQARCSTTAEDDAVEYTATVTVTSLDGDEATFDVEVDRQPQG